MGRPRLYDKSLNVGLPKPTLHELRQIACTLEMEADKPITMGDIARVGIDMALDLTRADLLQRMGK